MPNIAGPRTKKATVVEARHHLSHTEIGDRSRTAGAEPETCSACVTGDILCDQLKADGAMLDQKGESSPQASLGFRVSERLGYGQAISQVVEERRYSIPSCRRLPGSQEVRLGA